MPRIPAAISFKREGSWISDGVWLTVTERTQPEKKRRKIDVKIRTSLIVFMIITNYEFRITI
jgi:hypothetical protein